MKKLQFMRYLKKILPLIIIICVLATYAINCKLKESNTYVASEVIHYNDPQTELGFTPTGEKLDVNEIKSSAVVSKVVSKLGLTGTYSVDSLISRVAITPIPDEDKLAQKEAKLKEGESYIYEPSTYVVSFTATNAEGPIFARTILDEILDVYFAEYSQKYVNVAPANNTIDNIEKANYDYIETVELIDTGIDETLNTLYHRMAQNPYYRGSKTGVSFSDLADEFNYLRQVTLAGLFAKIYNYQVTQNKTILVSDYLTRIDNNNIAAATEENIANDTLAIIESYVDKMRESGNTDISSEYILDTIDDSSAENGSSSEVKTATYDELIYNWRNHSETKEHLLIDTAYCQYVIGIFTECTGACKNEECRSSAMTCTQMNNADYAKVKEEIEAEIKTLVSDLADLYVLTMETNDEYNYYLGASYISVLSSASVKPSVNVSLYTFIAFFFLIFICCGGAIVLGRIGDIMQYVFYTDHLTEIGNRAYFDKYLKSLDRKLLDDGTVYCVVDIANLIAINSDYSRETGDALIKLFTRYLKESFGKTSAEFIYNGNGSFVILAQDVDYVAVEDIIRLFSIRLDDRDDYGHIVIEYKVGIAETSRGAQTARKLLAESIKNKKTFYSGVEVPKVTVENEPEPEVESKPEEEAEKEAEPQPEIETKPEEENEN